MIENNVKGRPKWVLKPVSDGFFIRNTVYF